MRSCKNRHFLKYTVSSVSVVILLAASIIFAQSAASYRIQRNIVGGTPAQEGAWPWVVGLLYHWESDPFRAIFCGGTQIRARWVLTAAHCVFNDNGTPMAPQDLDILGGVTELYDPDGQRLRVARIIIHPLYNNDILINDIALIELEVPLTAEPVRLTGVTFDEFLYDDGTTAVALGWGKFVSRWSDLFPTILQQVSLPVTSHELCKVIWRGTTIDDTKICAGQEEGKDICIGDSGGPLVTRDRKTGEWTLIGITSFSDKFQECGAPDSTSVYTRVSRYNLWISRNICRGDERPSAPDINVTLSGNQATLAFDPIADAEGYRLFWAPYPEMTPISQLDMGERSSFSSTLPLGTQLFVAVESYNHNCLGFFSDIETVILPAT